MRKWYEDLIEDTVAERLALQGSYGIRRVSSNKATLEDISKTFRGIGPLTQVRGAFAVYGKVQEFTGFSSTEFVSFIEDTFLAEEGRIFYGLHEVYRNKDSDEHFIDLYVLPRKPISDDAWAYKSALMIFKTKTEPK